jgi:hypothetical protein
MLSYFMLAVTICFMLVIATHLISRNIYDHVPEAMGGGKAFVGRIILHDKGAEFWKQAGIIQGDDPVGWALTSRTATILYQDEKIMIVEISSSTGDPKKDKPKRMILSKGLVDAVVIVEK